MQFTEKEFQELKSRAEREYKDIGEVRCPFLDEKVVFNNEGLEHLHFKDPKHSRAAEDQFTRLTLLHLAPEVLKRSHTLQGISSGNKMHRVRNRKKWEIRMVRVIYYTFIAVLDDRRLKVIVKRINNEQPYFWSIIPYWTHSNHKRKLFEGNPEKE